jgi:hypothetical protein
VDVDVDLLVDVDGFEALSAALNKRWRLYGLVDNLLNAK